MKSEHSFFTHLVDLSPLDCTSTARSNGRLDELTFRWFIFFKKKIEKIRRGIKGGKKKVGEV